MARYLAKKIQPVIEAEQFFLSTSPWPRGVCGCEQGGRIAHVHTMHGGAAQTLKNGDYVIEEPNAPGHFYPCDQVTFEQKYEAETSPTWVRE